MLARACLITIDHIPQILKFLCSYTLWKFHTLPWSLKFIIVVRVYAGEHKYHILYTLKNKCIHIHQAGSTFSLFHTTDWKGEKDSKTDAESCSLLCDAHYYLCSLILILSDYKGIIVIIVIGDNNMNISHKEKANPHIHSAVNLWTASLTGYWHTHSTRRWRSFVYNCVMFTSLNE